MRSNKESCCL